ncbi:phosphotransferase family protein [Nonomuraea africana]|uniref:phosphotransferase family protein n=1 Tax=Nonomuraea africana TaxID=46171 RepID=UPI00298F35E2|nr:phosphotransferase [Nonomuraea africana]
MVIIPSAHLLDLAAVLLPRADLSSARLTQGQFHDVVLVPGVAAVRVAKGDVAASELRRRTEVLARLAGMNLPFLVPEPLGPVSIVDGRAAVAVSWVDGAAHPQGSGDPEKLRTLLDALASVDLALLEDVLDEPHAYAGRGRWAELLMEEVLPRLPVQVRPEARRRVEAALALEEVRPGLVHGDLAGENVRWSAEGDLVGVLDWDLAQPFDPAVDAACLAWHGWDAVRSAVDGETYRRARVWAGTFAIEQIGAALVNGEPPDVVDRYVESTARHLERQAESATG